MEKDQELKFTQEIVSDLGEVVRWARFLAIVGFVMVGLLVVVSLAMVSMIGNVMEGVSSTVLGFVYFASAIIYLIPTYYLHLFSGQTKTALQNHNQESLGLAFNNLKRLFKFIGVLTAIVLIIYFFAVVGMGIGGFIGQGLQA